MTTVAPEPATGPATRPKPSKANLPYTPDSASAGRRLVREKLREWGLDGLMDDAELIVSELVTNAAKTGCLRLMTVKVYRITATTVRISVRDGSRTLPVVINEDGKVESGQDMTLVNQLTGGQWGATLDPLGKTVHADLRLRQAS